MAKDKKKKNDNNISLEVDGETLTITIDLGTELRESETGKSTIVAATNNFESIEDGPDDAEYGYRLIVTKRKKKGKK